MSPQTGLGEPAEPIPTPEEHSQGPAPILLMGSERRVGKGHLQYSHTSLIGNLRLKEKAWKGMSGENSDVKEAEDTVSAQLRSSVDR